MNLDTSQESGQEMVNIKVILQKPAHKYSIFSDFFKILQSEKKERISPEEGL